MFTGIISDIGTLESVTGKGASCRLQIRTGVPLKNMALGASIACAGVCLTVVEKGKGWFAVDVSPETLKCTRIGAWKKGTKINLERALKIGDELGGHMVSGHADGLAKITAITKIGKNYMLSLSAPKALMPFIAKKGSVTLEGISLTVNKVSRSGFEVMIIPHTWLNTTLQFAKKGDALHLEIDMLARYTARLLEMKKVR